MNTTRYKQLFSVSATYELADFGITNEGVTVYTMPVSESKMTDLGLKPISIKNTTTVYYEGYEKPEVSPLTSEPYHEITTDEYFYFGVSLKNNEQLKLIKFHSSDDAARAVGFPVLYDAVVEVPNDPGVLTAREDVKIMLPVFTLKVIAADANIDAAYATVTITDENNDPVNIEVAPAPLNDKSIDGGDAVPEYSFSIDASTLETGIYTFKVGDFSKQYFLANKMIIDGEVSIIRVLKNSLLDYKKDLSVNDFVKFDLLIPKA